MHVFVTKYRIQNCHFAIEDGVGRIEIFHLKCMDNTLAICKLCMRVELVKASQTTVDYLLQYAVKLNTFFIYILISNMTCTQNAN